MGAGHCHHAGRRAGGAHLAGRAVPQHRPTPRDHWRRLRGRLGRNGGQLGHAGDRAAAQGHRQPAVHQRHQQPVGPVAYHADVCAGHQHRRGAGSGAEQAAAGHEPLAQRSDQPRRVRHQGRAGLPHGGVVQLARPQRQPCGCGRLPAQQPGRRAGPHRRRGRRAGVRHRLRHARLAGPAPAGEIRADARRRGQRDSGPERPGVGRPAGCIAQCAGPADQHRHHRAHQAQNGRAV